MADQFITWSSSSWKKQNQHLCCVAWHPWSPFRFQQPWRSHGLSSFRDARGRRQRRAVARKNCGGYAGARSSAFRVSIQEDLILCMYNIYIHMYSTFSQLDPRFSEVFFKGRWLIVKTYSTWCGSQSRELEFCSFSVYMRILKSYRIFHCMLMLYDPQFQSIVSKKGPQARCNFIFCRSPIQIQKCNVRC